MTSPTLLRIGAVSSIAGSVLGVVAGVLHPHPTEAGAMLPVMAESGIWSAIHLGAIVSALLSVAGWLALTSSVTREPGVSLARLSLLMSVVGVSVLVVGLTIDGFAGKHLADVWIGSVGLEQSDALRMSQAVERIHEGLFTMFVFLLFGVVILLYGLAVALGEGYPRGMGVPAVVSGTGTAVAGAAMFLSGGPSTATELTFLLLSLVSTGWMLTMGVLMWRKAAAMEAANRDVLQMQGFLPGTAGTGTP